MCPLTQLFEQYRGLPREQCHRSFGPYDEISIPVLGAELHVATYVRSSLVRLPLEVLVDIALHQSNGMGTDWRYPIDPVKRQAERPAAQGIGSQRHAPPPASAPGAGENPGPTSGSAEHHDHTEAQDTNYWRNVGQGRLHKGIAWQQPGETRQKPARQPVEQNPDASKNQHVEPSPGQVALSQAPIQPAHWQAEQTGECRHKSTTRKPARGGGAPP